MKNWIKRWLGICEHPYWETVGYFANTSATEFLVERCSYCSKVEFHITSPRAE